MFTWDVYKYHDYTVQLYVQDDASLTLLVLIGYLAHMMTLIDGLEQPYQWNKRVPYTYVVN